MQKHSDAIFKKGSQTYYNSSLFFPSHIRHDISILYAFVRVADDFVDTIPQNKEGFLAFKHDYLAKQSTNDIVMRFKEIEKKYGFDPAWTEAFFTSMEMDLHNKTYATMSDLQTYLHGSSEVIGLFINRILGISTVADIYAQYLGKAMQLINFVRDINEDLALDRIYIPIEDLKKFGISIEEFKQKQVTIDKLKNLIRFEIHRYQSWQKEAEKGYAYLPKRYRIAIKTAADMYKWTASVIYANPSIIYHQKVKPSKWHIILRGVGNVIFA